MLQAFGKEIEDKQNKRISHELALKFGELLSDKKYSLKITVNSINNTLHYISEKDPEFARCVLEQLKELYPTIHKIYTFEIKKTN